MAPRRGSLLVSSIKAAFGKSSSKTRSSALLDEDSKSISSVATAIYDQNQLSNSCNPVAKEEKPVAPPVAENIPPETTPSTAIIIVNEPKSPPEQKVLPENPPPTETETERPISTSSESTAVQLVTPSTTPSTVSILLRPADIMVQHRHILPVAGPQPTLVDLGHELSRTGDLVSPLPVNPAAPALCRAQFQCEGRHAQQRKSDNRGAPTLCPTCHCAGESTMVACVSCHLRICRRCAALLVKCRMDLEDLLGELVRHGVWKGLQGQG